MKTVARCMGVWSIIGVDWQGNVSLADNPITYGRVETIEPMRDGRLSVGVYVSGRGIVPLALAPEDPVRTFSEPELIRLQRDSFESYREKMEYARW